MTAGWRYRISSVIGTLVLTVAAVSLANHPFTQSVLGMVPVVRRLPQQTLSNGALSLAVMTTIIAVMLFMWPVFKPRPRRILDAISLVEQRLFLSMIALAAVGYYDWSYRLPRTTLLLTTVLLGVVLPTWIVVIRRRPTTGTRALLVGDDIDVMRELVQATDLAVIGYVAPPNVRIRERTGRPPPSIADGGMVIGDTIGDMQRLGGLSRLDEILVENEIETALLAFSTTDREEFFGTLAECHEHGVTAKVHRDHADTVLTAHVAGGDIVEIDLEPWDWQDHVAKRAFDVVFSMTALLVLSPVILIIAVAVKFDSSGPVLYSQERTAEFGDIFTVYKFRSMVTGAESGTGAKLSEEDRGDVDPRVTSVGRILRKTHLDEIPQLWSILVGDMSVVGPRPERPELDKDIGSSVGEWRRRWFVRPGLTGLAQIRGATGHEPEEKLRYDIEYIRRQSFWFDLKVVVRQLWQVGVDAARFSRENS